MKLPISLLALLICGAVQNARAETELTAAAPTESEWSITPALTSQYLFRGVRVAGACFQPSVDYSRGPLSLGVWSSVALERKDRNPDDTDPEIDLYGSYTIALGDSGVELVPGFSLYTYPDAERSEGYYMATFEPSVAANLLVGGVLFTPKIYYDVMLEGATYECTAAIALPLKTIGTELGLSASVGTFRWDSVTADASPDEKNWGDYWTIGASIPYQVSAHGSVTLAVLYSEGRNNFYKQGTDPKTPNEDAVGRTAVTLSYSLSL